MSLIQCPKCYRDIASTSEKCGYCGFPIKSKSAFDAEEAENDAKRAEYLSIVVKICYGALIIIVSFIVFGGNKKSQRRSIKNSNEVVIIDSPLIKVKELYKEGKFANAQMILNQLISNYPKSKVAEDASLFKIKVDSALKVREEQERIENQRLEKKRNEEARKRQKAKENLYRRDVIQYYKNLYGKPDSETDFTYDNYISKTLIWYCANGRYRSIEFAYKYSSWSKESEYATECQK